MKRIHILILLLFSFVCAIADEYTPNAPTITPSRYDAIGGYHVTDDTDYFSIFANPALTQLSGGKASWFFLDISLGGPIEEAYKALEIINEDSSTAQAELAELAGESGINANVEIIGPITLGSIHKLPYGALGWGLFNQTRMDFILPTASSMDLVVAEDILLQFTYGAPIFETENHYFSAGLSTKGYAIFEGLYSGSPLSLAINTDSADAVSTIPLYSSLGLAFDVGLYYKFAQILTAGLVWRDIASPVWVQEYTVDTIEEYGSANSDLRFASGSLDMGIGVNIPVGIAKAVITDFILMVDYKDILSIVDPLGKNHILNLSAGTELTLFDILSLRAGISDMYFNTGFGLQVGAFAINGAVFGKELGLEPGSIPQMNMSVSVGFVY